MRQRSTHSNTRSHKVTKSQSLGKCGKAFMRTELATDPGQMQLSTECRLGLSNLEQGRVELGICHGVERQLQQL